MPHIPIKLHPNIDLNLAFSRSTKHVSRTIKVSDSFILFADILDWFNLLDITVDVPLSSFALECDLVLELAFK